MECESFQFADLFYVLNEKHQGFPDGDVRGFQSGILGPDFEFG